MTLTLSSELAGHGITVNAIDPGPTDTGWISDELRLKILRESSEGISSPEQIARLVRLLSGDDAASITGQVIRAQAAGTADFVRGQSATHSSPSRS
jgi:3-oxoacyl-[acyl-carrier protein] reductase